jgi:hypothetical protein
MSDVFSCSATDTPKKKGAAAQRELVHCKSIAAQVDDRCVISSCASEMSGWPLFWIILWQRTMNDLRSSPYTVM